VQGVGKRKYPEVSSEQQGIRARRLTQEDNDLRTTKIFARLSVFNVFPEDCGLKTEDFFFRGTHG
jgi:hypothetical protein